MARRNYTKKGKAVKHTREQVLDSMLEQGIMISVPHLDKHTRRPMTKRERRAASIFGEA